MTQAATPTTTASSQKAMRAKFGVTQKPVEAVKAFKKAMSFDHDNVTAESWILLTPDNKIVRANLYNGQAGKNFNPVDNTQPAPAADTKEYRKATKGYTEVPVDQCPIAVAPVGTDTPAEQAANQDPQNQGGQQG